MRSERVSVLCLQSSFLLGFLALFAWKSGLLVLASFIGGTRAMAPLTALGIILSALAAYCVDRRHRERHPGLRFLLLAVLLLLCPCAWIAIRDALSAHSGPLQTALIPPALYPRLNAVTNGRTSLVSALTLCAETLALALFSFDESFGRRQGARPFNKAAKGVGRSALLDAVSCSSALMVALAGLAILVSFLYSDPFASGAVAFPSGLAFAFLGVGTALAIEGDPQKGGVWPLKAFFGPTMATKLLRAFVPLCAAITIGEGSLYAIAGTVFKEFSLATVVSFALLSLIAIVAASNVSRGLGNGIDALIEKRLVAERRLEASLRSREALLAELNHRTRNSLQLVLGLLDLEGAEDRSFSRVRERVSILAFIHEELSQGEDISAIESERFLEGLVSLFIQKGGLAYEKRSEPFLILFDIAAPLGFVADDIDDAIRTAAPRGAVRLELIREGGYCRLEYHFSLDGRLDESRLFVAKAIVEGQLGGSLVCEGEELSLISVRLGRCAYTRRV
jgi:hypothetical protein